MENGWCMDRSKKSGWEEAVKGGEINESKKIDPKQEKVVGRACWSGLEYYFEDWRFVTVYVNLCHRFESDVCFRR